MDHVVLFSGGIASWCAAKRVAHWHGTERLYLLFTDTLIEDSDLYRFLREGADSVGGELVQISDGRDPWQVFKDTGMLGNSRVDPCSRILKRELAERWVKEHYPDPESVRLYIGMNWDEEGRATRAAKRWEPYQMEAPLLERPFLTKDRMESWLKSEGIDPPRLYKLGFPHNNCGGGCVKAGQTHFVHLLKQLPEVFAEWERREEDVRQHLGQDVAILRDRRGGETRPMTLRELRERHEASEQLPMFEWGGCGCFIDE